MRRALIAVGLVLALTAPNVAIWKKERVLASGTQMLLELAPVDPRSLMQGDYMRLDYAIARTVKPRSDWPRDGAFIVALDSAGVATFVRRYEPGTALGAGQILLRYHMRDARVRVGSDAFFFKEGDAARYSKARYGELRVDADGTSMLVGLRDEHLLRLR